MSVVNQLDRESDLLATLLNAYEESDKARYRGAADLRLYTYISLSTGKVKDSKQQ